MFQQDREMLNWNSMIGNEMKKMVKDLGTPILIIYNFY